MARKTVVETDVRPFKKYEVTDPALNAAVSTTILDTYSLIIITTTTTGNAQTLQSPTVTTDSVRVTIANNDTSTDAITINGTSLAVGSVVEYVWDGSAWSTEAGGLTTVDLTSDVTGTLPVANGGTSSTTLAGASIATYTGTETFTNKRITKRVVTTTQSATPAINTDNGDVFTITGLAQAITSFTTNLTGTPTAEQQIIINITDDGTARAITWGTSFEASTIALPTTTVISTLLKVGFIYNTVTSKWRCVAVA